MADGAGCLVQGASCGVLGVGCWLGEWLMADGERCWVLGVSSAGSLPAPSVHDPWSMGEPNAEHRTSNVERRTERGSRRRHNPDMIVKGVSRVCSDLDRTKVFSKVSRFVLSKWGAKWASYMGDRRISDLGFRIADWGTNHGGTEGARGGERGAFR